MSRASASSGSVYVAEKELASNRPQAIFHGPALPVHSETRAMAAGGGRSDEARADELPHLLHLRTSDCPGISSPLPTLGEPAAPGDRIGSPRGLFGNLAVLPHRPIDLSRSPVLLPRSPLSSSRSRFLLRSGYLTIRSRARVGVRLAVT